MTSSKISKYISMGIRIAALILIVFFFIPSICVSCDDIEVNFSAFEAAMGKVEEDIAQKTDFVLFAILIFPIFILICSNIKPMVSVTMSVMNILAMIVYIIMVKLRCNSYFEGVEMMVNVKPKFAFVLNILLSLAIIGAIIFEQKIIDKFAVPEKANEDEQCCKTCGAPLNEADQVCTNCGAKIEIESDNVE